MKIYGLLALMVNLKSSPNFAIYPLCFSATTMGLLNVCQSLIGKSREFFIFNSFLTSFINVYVTGCEYLVHSGHLPKSCSWALFFYMCWEVWTVVWCMVVCLTQSTCFDCVVSMSSSSVMIIASVVASSLVSFHWVVSLTTSYWLSLPYPNC